VLSLGVLLVLLADSLLDLRSVGAGVDWSCVSRLEMLDTVDFNAARSCSALLGDPGIVGAVVVLWWCCTRVSTKFVVKVGKSLAFKVCAGCAAAPLTERGERILSCLQSSGINTMFEVGQSGRGSD
jgi:hypothetical protein